MPTPGQSSGTFSFELSNASILYEAFDRINLRPTVIDRHMLISARLSLNLELIAWENAGFSFWKLDSGTIPLVPGQGVYALPQNVVTLTDLYYTTIGNPNVDRIMVPITRTEYAAITNKTVSGQPTQYWFQMLDTPQITIWQVPATGAPAYVLNWYGLQQFQDAGIATGETPDIPRRAIDCLCAKMALRLCEKFGPSAPALRQGMMQEKKLLSDMAWAEMTRRDQEPGSITVRPNISAYARMR